MLKTIASLFTKRGKTFASHIDRSRLRTFLNMTSLEERAMPATLHGIIYGDLNANHVQDSGEIGVANAVVSVTDFGGVVRSTSTQSDGSYEFTNLTGYDHGSGMQWVYVISVQYPAGNTQLSGFFLDITADPNGTYLRDYGVTIPDGPVLPSVSVVKVNDAAEGGASGVFRFTRAGGNVSLPLTAYAETGGTASINDDYLFSHTIQFPANVTTRRREIL